jgi:DICT domain-containing protein
MRTVQHFVDDVPPVRLSKSMLVAISRAIEDEAAAWADQPVLVGAFQSDEFLRQSRARWDDLSRTSIATIVFAGPQTKRDRRKAAGNPPWIVPVGTGEPLVREWAVICDSARFCACLVATERLPAKPGTRTRYYEAIWTVAPIAVREATRTALSLAEAHHPTLGHLLADTLDQQPAPDAEAARTATILINRIAAELDRIGPARE